MERDPDGAGPASPLLVVAGDQLRAGLSVDVGILAWDGVDWIGLGTPLSDRAWSATVWNGLLVAAFETAYGVTTVATWDGAAWSPLGTFSGTAGGGVHTFAVHQNELHAGGLFTTVNGVSAANVARWNGSSWAALGGGQPHGVAAMVSFAGALQVGSYDVGTNIGHLEAWNGTAWSAVATCNGPITALATRITSTPLTTFLFAGGAFTQWTGSNGTIAASRVVRFNASANSWVALGNNLTGNCPSLGVRATGQASYELVAVQNYVNDGLWQWTGTTWVQLATPAPNAQTVVYFGGAWHLGSGQATSVVAMQRLQAGAWVPLNMATAAPGPIAAVLGAGNEVVVAGSFGIRQGHPGAWQPIGGLTGNVTCLARLANGDLVAAGGITLPGGQPDTQIVRWDGTNWFPIATGIVGGVNHMLALPSGELIVGGGFTSIGGTFAPYVARWTGSSWQALAGGMNAPVHALAQLPNGDIVAGGDFTLAGSLIGTALHIARWNGSSWSQFGPGLTNPVTDLAVLPGGEIAALTPLGEWLWNVAQRYVVVHGDGGNWAGVQPSLQFAWDPEALLALPDGDLLVAGGGVVRHGSSTTYVDAQVGRVKTLAPADDGDVLAGGDFEGIGTVGSMDFARLHATCPATALAYGNACAGSAGTLVLTPISPPWLGGTYRSRASGLVASGLTFEMLGFDGIAVPLAALHPAGRPGCDLLVNPVVTQPLAVTGGQTTVQLALPADVALAGIVLRDQVVQFELGPNLTVTAIASTNGLALTLGSF